MWAIIVEAILKWWVVWACGLLAGVITFGGKKIAKLVKEDRERQNEAQKKALVEAIKADNKKYIQAFEESFKTLADSSTKRYEELKQECVKINGEANARYEEITTQVDAAMLAGRDESKADDARLQEQITGLTSQISSLKAGLLSIQGKEFRENCRYLLTRDHEITIDEWEEIDADHQAYNGLGGNHKGDELFNMVKKKFENSVT